jgi:hypothetical protein
MFLAATLLFAAACRAQDVPFLAVARCLADPACEESSATLAASGPGALPAVAHIVSGQARTFSRQRVYESFRTNVVEAMPAAEHDVFVCLSKGRASQEIEKRPFEAWLAALAGVGRVIGVSVTKEGEAGDSITSKLKGAPSRRISSLPELARSVLGDA